MSQQYTKIAFTKHARERMQLRTISEEMVRTTILQPDKIYPEADGDTKFILHMNGLALHVVCKPIPEEAKWLVKSTWVRGENDDGTRTERYGRYGRYGSDRGRTRRVTVRPLPSEPQPLRIPTNLILFGFLLMLIGILVLYFLAR